MTNRYPILRFPSLFLAALAFAGVASDWEQFLGPARNGIYDGPFRGEDWPKEGPPLIWKKQIGQGFSGPVLASGKLILFHRLENQERIDCLDSQKGTELWHFAYPTSYRDDFGFDEGPRATPAISEGNVYSYGAEGMLSCCDFVTGKLVWSVPVRKEFDAPKGFFGIACSPLIESNSLVLIIGGRPGAGIVSFDKRTGKVQWKATDHEASYSSPVSGTIEQRRCLFCLDREGLVALEPSRGEILSRFPFRPPIHASVTAASPLVIGDKIFLSASYGTGAALLKLNGRKLEPLWKSDESLSAHYATPIHREGYLYGIHGRTDPGFEPAASLRCVQLATGKVMWEQPNFGAATLTLAGDQLLILTERGELIRARAAPAGFKILARAQILPNQVRAHPALADGFFYARGKDQLVCVDLSSRKAPGSGAGRHSSP